MRRPLFAAFSIDTSEPYEIITIPQLTFMHNNMTLIVGGIALCIALPTTSER